MEILNEEGWEKNFRKSENTYNLYTKKYKVDANK